MPRLANTRWISCSISIWSSVSEKSVAQLPTPTTLTASRTHSRHCVSGKSDGSIRPHTKG